MLNVLLRLTNLIYQVIKENGSIKSSIGFYYTIPEILGALSEIHGFGLNLVMFSDGPLGK